ncbi:MAG: hypothetical protein HY814_06805 [Candidatus Riflebacteria bacterium]|nr:hypothetical protein [Candidatus Riflebacteria bacterium]
MDRESARERTRWVSGSPCLRVGESRQGGPIKCWKLRHPSALVFALLALFLGTCNAWAQPAGGAAQEQFRPLIKSNTFNLEGSLQRVAHRLFQTAPGTLLTLQRQYDVQQFHQAAEVESYRVTRRGGDVVGSFLRMRVYPGPESVFDLALQVENGRIVAVEPVRPVVLAGKAFLGFPKALLSLREQEVATYARALARLFQAFTFIVPASEGQDKAPPFNATQLEMVRAWVKSTRPPLQPGVKMPAFSLTDVKGRTLTPARFARKRALLVFAMVGDDDSLRVMEWVRRYEQENPGNFVVAELLQNLAAEVDQYQLRGGTFAELAAADPDGAAYDALNVGFMPSLFLFDRSGKLVELLEPPYAGYDALAAKLDAVK